MSIDEKIESKILDIKEQISLIAGEPIEAEDKDVILSALNLYLRYLKGDIL